MGKTVFITGASSGIGKATAYKFAENGNTLIITGRRVEKLNELASELQKKSVAEVIVLAFDIRNRNEIANAVNLLTDQHKAPDILINNAGLALGLEPVNTGNQDDWETMIDTNIKGLLNVTRALIPFMIEKKSGHILNIGSIAGREVYLNGNVYCATKAAVDSISKAMRIDLLPHGIKVTQIAPGAVETEFSKVRFGGDEERASAIYNGFAPLRPEDVAEVIHYATTLPSHVNINDLLLMPASQASATIIQRKS
ncbi:MAG: SDR family NAD(P)-dependent oxidoreductase [Lentimicrobium sp.]|nr:SDR family NAD(P)-dependent oxidoreductase [Lentimicrobium sp.]